MSGTVELSQDCCTECPDGVTILHNGVVAHVCTDVCDSSPQPCLSTSLFVQVGQTGSAQM